MPTPGEQLRRARLKRNLSLEQIAAGTKIRVPVLQHLERDEYSDVAAGIYVRGFLGAFARQVGIDADALVREYVVTYETPPPPEPLPREAPPEVVAALSAANASHGDRVQNIVAAIAVAALAFTWTTFRHHAVPGDDAPGTSAIAASPLQEEDVEETVFPADAAPHAVDIVPAVDRIEPLVIEIAATDLLWLEVVRDGEHTVRQLMRPGARLQVQAEKEVSLLVGDAAAIRYAINGAPARAVGGSGQVRRLHITRDNFQTFLSSEQPG